VALSTDIARINTPTGGWKGDMPEAFLTECTDAIIDSAPDLRGTWTPIEVTINGEPAPPEVPLWRHVERIEQAGQRVTLTSDGIIHDFPIVDGTFENGCHDVAAADFATPIVVAASYEDGVLVLRPQGMDGVEVRRWRDGEHLMWSYHSAFVMKMECKASSPT
jgi:hypothetical protein